MADEFVSESDDRKAAARTFYVIRNCESLKAPALFLDWDDCNFYVEQEEDANDDALEYKEFSFIVDAVEYLLNQKQLLGPSIAKVASTSALGTTHNRDKLAIDDDDDPENTHNFQDEFETPMIREKENNEEDFGALEESLHQGTLEDRQALAQAVYEEQQTGKKRSANQASEKPSKRRAKSTKPRSRRRQSTAEAPAPANSKASYNWRVFMQTDHWALEFPEKIALLELYKHQFGGVDVPAKFPDKELHNLDDEDVEKYKGLGEWVTSTRKLVRMHYKEQFPDPVMQEKVDRLEEIGFVMQPKRGKKKLTDAANLEQWEDQFELNFAVLELYKMRYGTVEIQLHEGQQVEEEFKTLIPWIAQTKTIIKQQQQCPFDLSPSVKMKIQKLLDIGFSQHNKRGRKPVEEDWEEMFAELRAFKDEHGHCDVPYKSGSKLQRWVVKQKKAYTLLKEGKPTSLTARQVVRLTELGLTLQLKVKFTWEERAYQWLEYKTKEGRDPKRFSEDGLGKWVTEQRAKYQMKRENKKTNLTQEQIDTLTEWGFDWKADRKKRVRPAIVKTWEERYQDLIEYKRQHGTTSVPQFFPGLGFWVHDQRSHYKNYMAGKRSAMNPEKLAKLKAIGFVFRAQAGGRRTAGQSVTAVAAAASVRAQEEAAAEEDEANRLARFRAAATANRLMNPQANYDFGLPGNPYIM